MQGILVDANVLLDVATSDPRWLAWSSQQLQGEAKSRSLCINPIIYAELAPAFKSANELDRWLGDDVFARLPLPYSAGWLAGQAFAKYRQSGGARPTPLPDFYIGAHAAIENLKLITRDVARYRSYFPQVELICP